jgi:hypothetical protein
MEKRQIKMQDGRYLIFYTFADAPPPSAAGESGPGAQANGAAKEQPEAMPEAEEERSV